MDSIVVKDLCKRFPDFQLDHVSFRVPQGRIVGFMGENGAGKSTTINLILQEMEKDSGEVEVLGADCGDLAVRDAIGVVFDTCHFHTVFTAAQIGKMLAGIYRTWDAALYDAYLERFAIPAHQKLATFSKGMQVKLSIACALAHRPKLLILDEATSGLDPVVRDEFLDLFLEFIQDETHAIFFSSHIITDMEKIADYIIFIHKGKILFEKQKDDLLARYGILKCRVSEFETLRPEEYLVARQTAMGAECLVADRARAKREHPNAVVDAATLEEIMLFYAKGDAVCGA